MADLLYKVEWPKGSVLLHAKDEQRALEVALQFVKTHMKVQRVLSNEPGTVTDAPIP